MSATGRIRRDGGGGVREAYDNYATPAWCVHRLLEAAGDRLYTAGLKWREVAVGDGAILRAVDAHVTSDRRPKWWVTDIRESLGIPAIHRVEEYYIGDYLSQPMVPADVILTNPPYALAGEFLQKARKEAEVVCFLLRLNFIAPAKRSSWMRHDMPDIYVLPNRPSFRRSGEGKSGADATEYAWMIWEGRPRSCGSVTILPETSSIARR